MDLGFLTSSARSVNNFAAAAKYGVDMRTYWYYLSTALLKLSDLAFYTGSPFHHLGVDNTSLFEGN